MFGYVTSEVHNAEVERRITAEAREKVLTEQLDAANKRIDHLMGLNKVEPAPVTQPPAPSYRGLTPEQIFRTPAIGKHGPHGTIARSTAMFNAQKRQDAADKQTKLSRREADAIEERIGGNGNS